MPFVKDIHDRHHIHSRAFRISCINIIGQCDKTDIVHREYVVRVLTYLDIITPETAQILAEYQIDPAVLGIIEHSLHTRTVKCSA